MAEQAEGPVAQGVTGAPRSGVITVDVRLCMTCRECEVACSLEHEDECNPEMSRIRVLFDDLVVGFPEIHVCEQCAEPACYEACMARNGDDHALSIDARTGARYVEASRCRGCGACARACPLTDRYPVLRFRQVGRKRVYLKCDLCKDSAIGPICVNVCPGGALTFVSAAERQGETAAPVAVAPEKGA